MSVVNMYENWLDVNLKMAYGKKKMLISFCTCVSLHALGI